MKLIDKFTIWYLVITAFVLLVGGILVFYSVQHQIIGEERRKLKDTINFIAEKLKEGETIDEVYGYQIVLQEIDLALPEISLQVVDTTAWFEPHGHDERELRAYASYKVDGKHNYIAAYTFVGEPDEIGRGIMQSLSWVLVLLLLFVGIFSRIISKRMLAPFEHSLKVMQSFNLQQRDAIQLPETNTKEFRELNHFLEKMTSSALKDYRLLKEFTENTSHELQTPLAIIRGKLELLMESEISDEQAKLITDAHQSVGKLSKIHQSLILLAKLENYDFVSKETINFSKLINDITSAFEELIKMKHLLLESSVQDHVHVCMPPSLADILLNNLVSNAIRHNHPFGKIFIELTPSRLTIRNTGEALDVPVEQLFQRFKKNNQRSDSIGLGLAIVKQICELNHFRLEYHYSDHWHTLEVCFDPKPSSSK